jgi:hypothetical protein
MDEWRDFYYSMNPGARNVEIGDLNPRKKLRQDLKAGQQPRVTGSPVIFSTRGFTVR